MARVVCFGEALIDFLNTSSSAEDGLRISRFAQYPGGAPANAAVAVSKLGGDAAFVGQLGEDRFGDFLLESLQAYGVDTSLVLRHPSAPTALAFVFLDDSNDRHFEFVRQATADLVMRSDQVSDAWFPPNSMLHLCSNTLTDDAIAEVSRHVVSTARQHGSTISFDVNLRHNLWGSGQANADVVNAIARSADIVKLAQEELDYLGDGDDQAYLEALFDSGVTLVVVTDGEHAVRACRSNTEIIIQPPPVDVVDTTGGGDAFIGALLFGLSRADDALACARDDAALQEVLRLAVKCGAIAVSRPGAFPAFPAAADIAN